MFVLDNGDKIRGDAATAAVIDYTFHGVVGSDLTNIADGQLASATADLYTAGDIVTVTGVILVNTHSAAVTVNLFLLPSGGTARRILAKDFNLGIGFSLHYDGVKAYVLNPFGGIVAAYINHATSHTDGTDDIQDATAVQKGLATAAQITKLDNTVSGVISMTENTSPALVDLIYSIDDPSGTPLDRKVTLQNVMELAPHWVDGADPVASDFSVGDLTCDGNWHDLDLSAIVPAGAVLVLFAVTVTDDAVGKRVRLRLNGMTNAAGVFQIWTQVTNKVITGMALVGCDSNRVVEYNTDNNVFTTISFTVVGWVIDTVN